METRANYILIGIFTLLVVAGGFGFVYWFSQSGTGGERAAYRVLFEGSVTGLRSGASVLFNGIRVGEVVDLKLNPEKPKQVTALVAIDKSVPVRADTRIGLDFQGLTGIASVTLKGGSPTAPLLVPDKDNPPSLAADPNATQDVTQSIREVAASAQEVLKRMDGILADNEASLKETVANIKAASASLSATLDRNGERIDRVLTNLDELTGKETKTEIVDAIKSVRKLAENLDKRVAEVSVGLTRFSGPGLREYELLAADARKTLVTLERAIQNFDRNPSRILFGGSPASPVPEYSGRR